MPSQPDRRGFLRTAAAGVASLAVSRLRSAEPPPNVLYILADDLGYGDVHCLNPELGKIPTPRLDRLAAESLVFTDCHGGSAVCTPTRYGLLTGRYAWRTRLQAGVLDKPCEPLIAADRLTVPGLLRRHDYATAAIGKWHLGYSFDPPTSSPVPPLGTRLVGGPTTRGFDRFWGFSHARAMSAFVVDDRVAETVQPIDMLPRLVNCATDWLAQRKAAGRPFFGYLALNSPHTPIAPGREWQGRSHINAYADFVMQTDAAVGQVLDALEREGLAQNTLVVFTSDNGCSPAANLQQLAKAGHEPSAQYRGHKADIWDGGHRVPFFARWSGRVKPGRSQQLLCLTDLLATVADMVGEKLPDTAGEDSISFLPDLLGTGHSARTEAVHHSINGKFALRAGRWKLELCAGSGGWGAPGDTVAAKQGLPDTQLYDMVADESERRNLTAEQPEVVKRLTARLEQVVTDGRSTPGAAQANDVPVYIIKRGKQPAAEAEA